MAKLSSKSTSATQRVLVYGEPKTGKTELAGMLSKEHNLIWLDLENGHSTLFKLPQEQQDKIELVNIPDTKEYPIAIETLLKILTGKPVNVCDSHGKVSCPICNKAGAEFTTVHLNGMAKETILVIDSLTQLSNSAMSFLLRNESDTYKPEWPDYRNQGSLLDKALSNIQQAPYNVVAITHVIETELEDGSKRLVPLCGTTAFSRNTAKYFDHVVLTEMKNRTHKIGSGTGYSIKALTGSRTDIELEKEGTSILDIFKSTVGNFDPVVPEQLITAPTAPKAPAPAITGSKKTTAQIIAEAKAKASK